MAIQRNASGGGNAIKEAGEYLVRVTEVKVDKSKKGDPMLVVTFTAPDEKQIRGYFVQNLTFHMKNLETLKAVCGMAPKDPAGALIGRELGISVEVDPPGPDGRSFSGICGYGTVAELENAGSGFASNGDDSVLF